jgi:hypothetical protein
MTVLTKINHPVLYFLLIIFGLVFLSYKSFIVAPYPTYLEVIAILTLSALFICILFEKLGLYGPLTARTGFWSLVISALSLILMFSADVFTATPEQLNSISSIMSSDKKVANFVVENYKTKQITMMDAFRIQQYSKTNGNDYSKALLNFNNTLSTITLKSQ